MAKIQNFSKAFLPFISRYDIGLDLYARDDEREHAVTLMSASRQQIRSAAGDRMKIRRVGNYAMLNCLCNSRANLAKWKCSKDLRVGKNCGRWVKRADQILAGRSVDGSFSADGSVDHGEQGRWNLDDRDPPHECRRNEAREVSNDPTAKRDNGGVS